VARIGNVTTALRLDSPENLDSGSSHVRSASTAHSAPRAASTANADTVAQRQEREPQQRDTVTYQPEREQPFRALQPSRELIIDQIRKHAAQHVATGHPLDTRLIIDLYRNSSTGLSPSEIAQAYEQEYLLRKRDAVPTFWGALRQNYMWLQTSTSNPLQTLFWTVGILGGLITVARTIRTASVYAKRFRDRRVLRSKLSLYSNQDIVSATANYVPPDCQSVDPALGDEPGRLYAATEPIFKAVRKLLAPNWEHKFLILLADSGMGKTSFLLNYYIQWHRRDRRRYNLAIIPLGFQHVDIHIRRIPDQPNTVLFLDAFDEDMQARYNHAERLRVLLDLCSEFRQVLITCRTQFFLKDTEVPAETGILRVRPTAPMQSREHVFYRLYLSPLNQDQVNDAINRRFPFWRRRSRAQANEIGSRADVDSGPLGSVCSAPTAPPFVPAGQ
jgi:hypothetical protein